MICQKTVIKKLNDEAAIAIIWQNHSSSTSPVFDDRGDFPGAPCLIIQSQLFSLTFLVRMTSRFRTARAVQHISTHYTEWSNLTWAVACSRLGWLQLSKYVFSAKPSYQSHWRCLLKRKDARRDWIARPQRWRPKKNFPNRLNIQRSNRDSVTINHRCPTIHIILYVLPFNISYEFSYKYPHPCYHRLLDVRAGYPI